MAVRRALTQIEVVVHPQSIVHSMVELKDGSIIAQMGITDMRLPIQYAFAYPDRWDAPVPFLDLTRQTPLEFLEPAWDDFPCLRLAYRALETERSLPIVLNAANEVAVRLSWRAGLVLPTFPKLLPRRWTRTLRNRPSRSLTCAGRRLGPEHAAELARELELESMTTLLSFLFVLGVLVFIHELGHFLLAAGMACG